MHGAFGVAGSPLAHPTIYPLMRTARQPQVPVKSVGCAATMQEAREQNTPLLIRSPGFWDTAAGINGGRHLENPSPDSKSCAASILG